MEKIDVSVILPCRNEELTIKDCIQKIKKVFRQRKINGEILVSDSSTDNSAEIAKGLGVRVIRHGKQGYGNAYLEAFPFVNGKYIIIGDADNTYDFLEIPRFIDALDIGYDFVIGSRFRGEILPGAMKWLHQYVGNPILNALFNYVYKTSLSDTHCGYRAFRRKILHDVQFRSKGMEFALEMIIKTVKSGYRIYEIPITYHPRKGVSKLHSFRDGFRHFICILWNKAL